MYSSDHFETSCTYTICYYYIIESLTNWNEKNDLVSAHTWQQMVECQIGEFYKMEHEHKTVSIGVVSFWIDQF